MALLRNADNVVIATDLQVLVSFADDPKIGRGNGLFGDDWHTVGMLAEGSTITSSRDADETEIQAVHYGTLRTIRKPGRETVEFEVIEDNPITRKIANPSETAEGVRFNDAKRLPAFIAVVFVKNNGNVEIAASRYKANLFMEEYSMGEELEGKTVTAEITKGNLNDTFDVEYFKLEGDALVKVNPIRFVDDSEITNDNVVNVQGEITKGADTEFPFSDADREVAGGTAEVSPEGDSVSEPGTAEPGTSELDTEEPDTPDAGASEPSAGV